MKRVIMSRQGIYGMSFPRSEAIAKMSNLSSVLNEHLIECVVYSEMKYLTVPHWVGELAAWMNRANKIKCKTRLKKQDYLESIFGSFGDSLIDADVNLDEYKRNNARKLESYKYPDFEITEELIKSLYDHYQAVIKCSLPVLMSKGIKSVLEWKELLTPLFM